MPDDEPAWLQRLRSEAKQRPRTQFTKVRWHDLQQLLQQRDMLLRSADPESRTAAEAFGRADYGIG